MTAAASASSLVGRARDGDDRAFEELIRPLLPRALGAALLVTGQLADAEDATQDALLEAWRDVGTVRRPDAFAAWFRRLVMRAAVRRAVRRRKERHDGLAVFDTTAASEPFEQAVWFRLAFSALSPDDRSVVVARYYLGYTTAETSELLAIPAGTVKSRLHYALGRLRVAGTGGEE